MAGCSNYNSLEVRRASRSKRQARDKFAAHSVPHAKGTIFINPFTAHRFAREHGFPLCIKPNVSGFSRGSHFPITNYRQLWRAALWVKVWWLGANYRVLATDSEMVSVIRRYPPFVDGNGIDTISALIRTENNVRQEMQLYPTIYPIKESPQVISYLKNQGLTLDSVPAADERVYVFNRVALAPGGIVETIDQSTIPQVNRDLFYRVVTAFDAKLFGIDVIFEKGIEVPYNEQRCIFLEVNSRPYTRMHEVPRFGKTDDLEAFYRLMDDAPVADSDIF